jgi:hypothetical protein
MSPKVCPACQGTYRVFHNCPKGGESPAPLRDARAPTTEQPCQGNDLIDKIMGELLGQKPH